MNKALVCCSAALVLASAFALAQTSVTAADREAIQSLVARYAKALGSCDSAGFADLFEQESGVFASGFRGRIEGREQLVALVEGERHCRTANPDGSRGRAGGLNAPTVSIEAGAAGVLGVADLGAAGRYQDEYVRTPQGWKFASRTVLTPAEMAAGLDAKGLAAIQALSEELPAVDHHEVDDAGKQRFLSSGAVIRVDGGAVKARP